MGSTAYHPLHIFLFPFLTHGHMIPIVDMAKLFVQKGVKATIITTPLNAPFICKAIGKFKANGNDIHMQTIDFPSAQFGLPDGCENSSLDLIQVESFIMASSLLQGPFEQLLEKQRPNCVVADMFFPWATDSAAKFGIPRLVFHGTGFLALCATTCIGLYSPHDHVSSDSELFVIPNLPGEIKATRMQLPPFALSKEETSMAKLVAESRESELRSFGVVVNSFYELEKVYADHYRKVLGRKAWHIGPLSLCNKDMEEKVQKGDEVSINEHECLKWLDTKKPNSVVYVCFGSIANFPDSHLREIALGLEASGHQFIWVVRKSNEEGLEWLPDGFEKRVEGKGLIIKGWAPQVLILGHEAIGAFVTHCGWNSTLEAVSAGVPMVTWPLFAEQFYNETLVTEMLKTGVAVGANKWIGMEGNVITWDAVEKAVKRIMNGEEATEIRNNAKVLSKLAKRAMEEEGSSYSDLEALIEELSSLSH